MNNLNMSTLEKLFILSSLEKKIDECSNLSLAMKGITALILFVNFVCAKEGDSLVVIISLFTLVLFFFLDVFLLKKKKEYETKIDIINNVDVDTIKSKSQVKLPIVYYSIMAVLLIMWLIEVS